MWYGSSFFISLLNDTARRTVQLWSDLLWLSGGLLDHSKCYFHQIHFNFEPDGTPMMRAGIFGDPLQVQDESTITSVTIRAKYVFTSHKTLGHRKALRQ
jgi:hypothetical protein